MIHYTSVHKSHLDRTKRRNVQGEIKGFNSKSSDHMESPNKGNISV